MTSLRQASEMRAMTGKTPFNNPMVVTAIEEAANKGEHHVKIDSKFLTLREIQHLEAHGYDC